MTFYIQQVKGQRHSDIIMSCKNPFLAIIQRHNPEKEGEILRCIPDDKWQKVKPFSWQ